MTELLISQKRKSLELILGPIWAGKMVGNIRDCPLEWELVFNFQILGSAISGYGLLRGSATTDQSLAFGFMGDSHIDPATGSDSMIIAVTDPLPAFKKKAYLRFEFSALNLCTNKLEALWHMPCVYPNTCGCAGGFGNFTAHRYKSD